MVIRQFVWRDLPILLRYRNRGLFFDNAAVLTRGELLVPAGAMLSYFAPAIGTFTYICTDQDNLDEPLLGQITHDPDEQLAHLSFLAPITALDEDTFFPLLEHIVQQVGKRGAFHLLAEVEERTTAFENLRQAGFALYVHQRIWQGPEAIQFKSNPTLWRDITSQDIIAVRSLYNTLVPALVQQVESLPTKRMKGLVHYQDDQLLAYAEIKYGQRGIWVHPFIHPDMQDVTEHLADLLYNLPNRHSRPVYLCVRSYQSWLENSLEDLQAKAGPLQAVMVKHLAVSQKVTNSFTSQLWKADSMK